MRNDLLDAHIALQQQQRLAGDPTHTIAQPGQAPASGAPPGMSLDDVKLVQGAQAGIDAATLAAKKLGVLHATALWQVSPQECVLMYLIAACDGNDAVRLLNVSRLLCQCV